MKKLLYILPLALATLVSCQKEESFTSGDNAVTINAKIGENMPLGRANTTDDVATSWKNSDQIAVNNEGDSYVTYTYSGTSWAAAPGDFLKWSAETMIFNGYHPVTQGTSLTNFTLPIDQSDLAKISAADYMIVENASKTKPESGYAVDLNFTRKNARVIIKIAKFNNEFVGTPIIKNLTITSAHSNYTSGATQGASTTITPYKVLNEDTYIALVIPYNSTTNVDFINLEVTDDIDTQSLKLSEIPATEPGKSYTYNLTVGKQIIEVNAVTVADWNDTVILPDDEAINKCDDWDGTYATELTAGTGTKDDPYLIQTAEELALLSTIIYNQEGATNYSKCCFKLTTDIDLKYQDWTPIGSGLSEGKVPWYYIFIGSFDGDGHTISGLKVTAVTNDEESIAYVGLFGKVGPDYEDQTIPSIQNLIVRDAKIYAGSTVTGNDNVLQGAGILAGQLTLWNLGGGAIHTAKIKNCRVSGTIHQVDGTTTRYVGGLVGHVQGAEVTNCNANVTIDTQNGCVGGLLGYAFGTTVKNSHCKGSIKGGWSIGGFVGGAEKLPSGNMTITDCTTSVEVTASNWNVGGFIGYFLEGTIANCSASGNVISTVNWKNHLYKTGGFVGTNAGLIDKCTYSGALTYADTAEDAWKYYGGFTGNHKGGTTQDCRFDGRKNPSLDKSGLSWMNENIEIGSNDISNTLE